MQTGGEKITQIKSYDCGTCENHLEHVFKKVQHEKRDFPARTLIFVHEEDYYLVDTGYSERVLENGWKSKIYNKILPVHFQKEEGFRVQLLKDGFDLTKVKGIILTHLHPDHLAGLKDFPELDIFISQETYQTYKNPRLFDLIFDNLIPEDFEERLKVIDISDDVDFFGDGSLILKDVSGHTKGQIGLHFTEYQLFYAADASWGMDLIDHTLKLPAQFLQKDMIAYRKSQEKLKAMQAEGVKIVVSHDINVEL